jgi:hypothetical protein
MTRPISRQTTIVLPNERMLPQELQRLAYEAVAAQLHGTGEKLIRVHLTTGTAVKGNDHLMSWPVTYECLPADTE